MNKLAIARQYFFYINVQNTGEKMEFQKSLRNVSGESDQFNFKYIGNTKNLKGQRAYLDYFPDDELVDERFSQHSDFCVCGHKIKYNYFIMHKTTQELQIVGSECVKKYTGSDSLICRKCDQPCVSRGLCRAHAITCECGKYLHGFADTCSCGECYEICRNCLCKTQPYCRNCKTLGCDCTQKIQYDCLICGDFAGLSCESCFDKKYLCVKCTPAKRYIICNSKVSTSFCKNCDKHCCENCQSLSAANCIKCSVCIDTICADCVAQKYLCAECFPWDQLECTSTNCDKLKKICGECHGEKYSVCKTCWNIEYSCWICDGVVCVCECEWINCANCDNECMRHIKCTQEKCYYCEDCEKIKARTKNMIECNKCFSVLCERCEACSAKHCKCDIQVGVCSGCEKEVDFCNICVDITQKLCKRCKRTQTCEHCSAKSVQISACIGTCRNPDKIIGLCDRHSPRTYCKKCLQKNRCNLCKKQCDRIARCECGILIAKCVEHYWLKQCYGCYQAGKKTYG